MPRPRKAAVPDVVADALPETAERGASVASIAQDIATAVLERRLPPGTWLREEALGRVYSVSRTKIRAALMTLLKDKLIEIVPDKGAFVSKPSVQEARELFSVRRVLESEVVRLFVARAKPKDYVALEQHIKLERATLRGAATGTPTREKLLGDFHVELAEACGQRVLAELVRELVARSSLIAMLYQSHNDPTCSTDEHEVFLRLCKRGDADAAVAEMVAHLNRVEGSLQLDDQVPDRQLDLVKALLM